MNQELYSQLLDGASVIVAVQKFEEAIEAKKSAQADCCAVQEAAERKIKKAEESYGKRRGWGKFMIIFGSISGLLFLLSTLITFVDYEFDVLISETISLVIVNLLFVALVFMGVLLVRTASTKREEKVKEATEECKKIQTEEQARIDRLADEIDNLEKRKKKYIIDTQPRLSFLPADYCNPHAIGFMLKALENMRADNLKELVNLYEQELHFLKQERILSNNAEMQKIYNENMLYAMESINRNQEQMKTSLQFIETMQFISMLDD